MSLHLHRKFIFILSVYVQVTKHKLNDLAHNEQRNVPDNDLLNAILLLQALFHSKVAEMVVSAIEVPGSSPFITDIFSREHAGSSD